MMLSDVCLSVCHVHGTSGLSREQKGLGRLKLAQRQPTSRVTRTPLSRSKGQRSRSPGCFTHGGVNASGSRSGERGNVLAVGTYCYIAVCTAGAVGSAARGASAPTEGGEGREHIMAAARLQLVTVILHSSSRCNNIDNHWVRRTTTATQDSTIEHNEPA